MIHILLSLIGLQKWYKLVKVTIEIREFAEVIFDVVICHYCLPSLVVINSDTLYHLETCRYYAIF